MRRWPHAAPPAGVFAHAGKDILLKGSDGGSLTTLRQGAGRCGVVTRGPPSDSNFQMKKPAADFSARALEDFCDDAAMPVICPTCQIV